MIVISFFDESLNFFFASLGFLWKHAVWTDTFDPRFDRQHESIQALFGPCEDLIFEPKIIVYFPGDSSPRHYDL